MAGRGPVVAMVGLGVLVAACAVAAAVVPRPSASGPALPASGPGTPTVTLSLDARNHPEGESVRSLLQRHFDAINSRNYPGWAATVVPERAARICWASSLPLVGTPRRIGVTGRGSSLPQAC